MYFFPYIHPPSLQSISNRNLISIFRRQQNHFLGLVSAVLFNIMNHVHFKHVCHKWLRSATGQKHYGAPHDHFHTSTLLRERTRWRYRPRRRNVKPVHQNGKCELPGRKKTCLGVLKTQWEYHKCCIIYWDIATGTFSQASLPTLPSPVFRRYVLTDTAGEEWGESRSACVWQMV